MGLDPFDMRLPNGHPGIGAELIIAASSVVGFRRFSRCHSEIVESTINPSAERGSPSFSGHDFKEPAKLGSRFFFVFGGSLAPGAGCAKPPSLSARVAFGGRLFLVSGEATKIMPKAAGHQSCANNDFCFVISRALFSH